MNTSEAAALPVLLVAGWLGAGKTTLINHLLRHAQGRRLAVLVNDFGDVNLDAELIVSAEAGVLQLAGGCLCCSFGDDLLGTLSRLASTMPRPDHLLIELSGVALPGPVQQMVTWVPQVQYQGTVVIVDSLNIRQQLQDRYVGDTVRQQLISASWLLPSKSDLPAAPNPQEFQNWLQQQAPKAQCLPGPTDRLPTELLLGWHGMPFNRSDSLDDFPLRKMTPHLSGLFSRTLSLPAGSDLQALLAMLDQQKGNLLRAKAILGHGDGVGQVLHWVAGKGQIQPHKVNQLGGHLVMIGLDASALESVCDRWTKSSH